MPSIETLCRILLLPVDRAQRLLGAIKQQPVTPQDEAATVDYVLLGLPQYPPLTYISESAVILLLSQMLPVLETTTELVEILRHGDRGQQDTDLPFHIADSRYAFWRGAKGGFFDLTVGNWVDEMAPPLVVCTLNVPGIYCFLRTKAEELGGMDASQSERGPDGPAASPDGP